MVSEIYYRPIRKVHCEDGSIRTAYARAHRYDGSLASDTYFSVPAYVYAKGKTVRGYISGAVFDDGTTGYEFRAYTYCKNHSAVEPVA